MQDEMITPENVSNELLKNIFDRAYFKTSFDDNGNFLFQDRFRTFIDINKNKNYLTLNTHFKIDTNAPFSNVVNYANRINRELIQVKAIAQENLLSIEYDVWIEGGILDRNIIFAAKFFASQLTGVVQKDEQEVLL